MLFKDFSKFKFNVIDVKNAALPEMTINLNGIFFNQACLDILGKPERVHFLLDVENKVFAVQVCNADDSKGVNFTSKDYKSGYSGTCKAIRISIRNTMADVWSEDKRYKMDGVVFAANKAIAFDLTNATELPALPTTGVKRSRAKKTEE